MIINVPYQKQKYSTSCLPAAIKMVMHYFGVFVDEKILLKKGTISGHKGTWDAKLAPYIIKKGFCFESYWKGSAANQAVPHVQKAYIRAMATAKKVGWRYCGSGKIAKAKQFLAKKIPVIAELNAGLLYKKKYEWTHVIVLTGFNKNGFYYLDSYAPAKKPRKISFARFARCWECNADCQNSMMVIYPRIKRQSH